jgi:hypothetical protein
VQTAAAFGVEAFGPWLAEVAVCPSEKGGPTQSNLTCKPVPRNDVEHGIDRRSDSVELVRNISEDKDLARFALSHVERSNPKTRKLGPTHDREPEATLHVNANTSLGRAQGLICPLLLSKSRSSSRLT